MASFASKQILFAQALNDAINAKLDAMIGATMQTAITRLENLGSQSYLGTWDASTNTPTITSGVGFAGNSYTVAIAGSTTIDGISTWNVGDKITFNGTEWQRTAGLANSVASVAGLTDAISAADLKAALAIAAADIVDASVAGILVMKAANSAALRAILELGTAAQKVAGTKNGNVLLLSADDKLPALDGSQLTNIPGIPTSRSVTGGGLATGGGALSDDQVITVPASATADYRGKTNAAKPLTSNVVWGAMVEVGLSVTSNIATPNLSGGIDFSLVMAGNYTLANPSNMAVGQKGRIRIVQDAGGSKTLAYGSYYKWPGGTPPILSTAPNAVDFLDYDVVSTTYIRAALSKAWS